MPALRVQIDKSHPIYPRNEEKVKKRQVRVGATRSVCTRARTRTRTRTHARMHSRPCTHAPAASAAMPAAATVCARTHTAAARNVRTHST